LREDKLRDAHPARHGKGLRPEIDEKNAHLAAIIGIDGAGRVEHRDGVPKREARARPHFALVAVRNFEDEAGRDGSPAFWGNKYGIGVGERRDEIDPGGAFRLVSGRGQADRMRQPGEGNVECAHARASRSVVAIRRTSPSATASLERTGQLSTPPAVTRCTWLFRPPNVPLFGDTSFATIQSQPLRRSFSRACSSSFSVSAAKPTTRRGRFLPCESVA